VVIKNTVFWDKRRVAHLKSSDALEEHITSIFMVEQAEQDSYMQVGGKPFLFQQIIQCYIPEDSTLQIKNC
jgi:hypothetical protein